MDLVSQMKKAVNEEPWVNPPSMRKLMKLEVALTEKLRNVGRRVREIYQYQPEGPLKHSQLINVMEKGGARPKIPDGWQPAAAAMTDEIKDKGYEDGEMFKVDTSLQAVERIGHIVQCAGQSWGGASDIFGPKAHAGTNINRSVYWMS